MEEQNPPGINQGFFRRLNNNTKPNDLKLELASDSLKNVLTKEIKFKDLNERLLKSRQEKVLVREVVLESEIEFVNSLKQLKSIFKEELKTAIDKVNDLYTSELLKLQKIYKSEVIGDALLEIVKTISKSGWILLMKDSGVYVYKYYSPAFEVYEGYTEKGTVKEYEEPVCKIKGIYINILHPSVTYGTILLATEGHHPNVDKANFGSACIGTFEDRDIPLDNPAELLGLLNEIQACYEVISLDSCYY
ncbi:MAG TPA: hypothetical protein VIL99_05595, partial [Ignavibacteria bacterium]